MKDSAVQVIFKKHLDNFERTVLAKYGYVRSKFRFSSYNESSGILAYDFDRADLKLATSFFASDLEDGRALVSFMMHEFDVRENPPKRSFALSVFQKRHNNHEIKEVCMPGEDFEEFTIKYFRDLETAFATYLNGQITGKTFESFDPRDE